MQQPKLELSRGTTWGVRYKKDGKRVWKTLGRVEQFPTEASVAHLYHEFLAKINVPSAEAVADIGDNVTVSLFVERIYLPEAKKRLRGNTYRGYAAIWKGLQDHTQLGAARILKIKTPHIQAALNAYATAKLGSKASYARVKSFLTQVFAAAAREGYRDESNPVRDTKLPAGRKAKETSAYNLADTERILKLLSPGAATICAVAAFAGLRRGEIFGLQWHDWDEKENILYVRREVAFDDKGRMLISEPKTETSKAPVPVIGSLKTTLASWKASAVEPRSDTWMFPAAFVRTEHPANVVDALGQTPINPGNFVRDQIEPMMAKAGVPWKGFHAFRRGLATNLHALGVQDIDVQQILRHSDVSVTRDSYIKAVSETARSTMDKFEVAWAQMRQKEERPN